MENLRVLENEALEHEEIFDILLYLSFPMYIRLIRDLSVWT
jgi:hypothetical protein